MRSTQVFDEILRDLRTQYLIGFYPKNVPLTKDRFHQLEIRLSQPGFAVVSRTGYYGRHRHPAADLATEWQPPKQKLPNRHSKSRNTCADWSIPRSRPGKTHATTRKSKDKSSFTTSTSSV